MMDNGVTTLAASFLIGSPFFAGKKDNHKSLDEFEGSLTVWALYAYFSDSKNAAFELLGWCM